MSEDAEDLKIKRTPLTDRQKGLAKRTYENRSRKIESLEEQTIRDPLTGSYNRRFFDVNLPKEIENRVPYSMMVIDIDDFKEINDNKGHSAGDETLKNLTRTLNQVSRVNDFVIRLGGDEFVVVLPETDDLENLRKKAKEILNVVGNLRTRFKDENFGFTISIGISSGQESTPEGLKETFDKADKALLDAKGEGKNKIVFGQKTNV